MPCSSPPRQLPPPPPLPAPPPPPPPPPPRTEPRDTSPSRPTVPTAPPCSEGIEILSASPTPPLLLPPAPPTPLPPCAMPPLIDAPLMEPACSGMPPTGPVPILTGNSVNSSFMSCWMMKCLREMKLFLPTWKSTCDLDELRPTSITSSLMSSMLSLLISRPMKLPITLGSPPPLPAAGSGAAAGAGAAAGRAATREEGPLLPVAPVDAATLPAPLLSFADAVDSVGDGEDTGEDADVRLERSGVVAGWLLLEVAADDF
uniref:Uncharacterized protein n=1 Tax=Anopheles merus TaxID=30066 RepID=A0A182UTD4_ANOME